MEESKQTTNITRAYQEKASKRIKFWVGDQVLIKLWPEQIWFRECKDQHLVRKYEGHVEVLKRVENTSYRVVLPTWMKIHPVIHMSNLNPCHQDHDDMQRNVIVWLTIDLS